MSRFGKFTIAFLVGIIVPIFSYYILDYYAIIQTGLHILPNIYLAVGVGAWLQQAMLLIISNVDSAKRFVLNIIFIFALLLIAFLILNALGFPLIEIIEMGFGLIFGLCMSIAFAIITK